MLVYWLAEKERGAKCVQVPGSKEKSLKTWSEDLWGHMKPDAMKGCGLFFKSDLGQAVTCWPSCVHGGPVELLGAYGHQLWFKVSGSSFGW